MDLSYDDKGRKRELPGPERIREIVMERIREREKKFEEMQDGDSI